MISDVTFDQMQDTLSKRPHAEDSAAREEIRRLLRKPITRDSRTHERLVESIVVAYWPDDTFLR